MKKIILIIFPAIFFSIINLPVWADSTITTDKQKLSYALGAYFSQSVSQQNVDLDVPVFLQAIDDVLNKRNLKLTTKEIQEVLAQYQQKLITERTASANSNKAAGKLFLEENKKKKGVIELPSGLQYKIIKEGSGPKPTSDGSVNVHYQGTLIDGKVFDSSYERGQPVTLTLKQVIKGWQEALPLMSVGSKWQIYVPPELAYGERGAGNAIGPDETLIFDIELLAIN